MAWWEKWLRKSMTVGPADVILQSLLGAYGAKSGATVTHQTALRVTTVLGCARVIAEGISQVPLKLMQEKTVGNKTTRLPAVNHPLYRLLNRRPNAWQTSFEFREQLAFHLVLTGNAYCFINRIRGDIRELVPLEPQSVQVKRDDYGVLTYVVTGKGGAQKPYPAESIWQIRGPSWCGYLGLDAVVLAREAIGLALSIEETQSAWHRNGAKPSMALSVDGTLGEVQYKQLRQWLQDATGSGNAGVPLITDRAGKWVQWAMSGVDMEHLATRNHQVEEICRALRVMPIMVGYSDKASTYASAEQMFLAHVVHTLAPWYERIEQSIDVNLLTDADRDAGIYANFVEEGLLRGSIKDTKDVLLGYTNGGVMTPNEARAKLDLNPDDDPKSDELRIPANIVGEPDPQAQAADAAAKEKDVVKAREHELDVAARMQPNVTVHPAPVHVTVPEQKSDPALAALTDELKAARVETTERLSDLEGGLREANAAIAAAKESAAKQVAEALTQTRFTKPIYDGEGRLIGAERVANLE